MNPAVRFVQFNLNNCGGRPKRSLSLGLEARSIHTPSYQKNENLSKWKKREKQKICFQKILCEPQSYLVQEVPNLSLLERNILKYVPKAN